MEVLIMPKLEFKFVEFTVDGASYVGIVITLVDFGVSILLAYNLVTGHSYQLTLPGFDK
jgi:hypothetical protein